MPILLTIRGSLSDTTVEKIVALATAEGAIVTRGDVGNAPDIRLSEVQAKLLTELFRAGGTLDTNNLQTRAGVKPDTIRPAMSRLVEKQLVVRGTELSGPRSWLLTETGRTLAASLSAQEGP